MSWKRRAPLPLVALASLAISFLIAMNHSVEHDENHFVAPAYLALEEGLRPYSDFPYFHTPYLLAPYELAMLATDHRLLAARSVSVVGSSALLFVFFLIGYRVNLARTWKGRVLCGLAVWAALLSSPLFRYVTGKAWNHDWSLLPIVVAFIAFVGALGARGRRSALLFAASGFLLGVAAGVRLTCAVLPVAFGLALLFPPLVGRERSARERLRSLGWLAAGCLVALLPLLPVLLRNFEAFWLNAVGYASLNTEYRIERGYTAGMSPVGKIKYMQDEVFRKPVDLAILLSFLYFFFRGPLRRADWGRWGPESRLIFFLLPFLALMAMAPTPAWIQYFSVFVPFLILGTVFRVRDLEVLGRHDLKFLLLLGLVAFAYGLGELRHLRWEPRFWAPLELKRVGAAIRSQTADGDRIFTFSPLPVIEAGRRIYPSQSSGPFAFRVAHLLDEETRRRFHYLSADDLEELFRESPPDGFLTGWEPTVDPVIVKEAEARGFVVAQVIENRRGPDLTLYTPGGR